MMGAVKVGSANYSPRGTGGGFEASQALDLIRGNGDWRLWIQRLESGRRSERQNLSGIGAALLACSHPEPPYTSQDLTATGLRTLAPESRYEPQPEGEDLRGILILAFDNIKYHVGEVLADSGPEALTRLQSRWAPTVTKGHRGL